jgi:hypothetical protein
VRAAGAFVLGLVLLGGTAASARSGEEEWGALSTTAIAITGDIVLSPTRMRTAGAIFPLKLAADLSRFRTSAGVVGARVLQITRPMNPVLLNGNTLCGRKPPRWIAV